MRIVRSLDRARGSVRAPVVTIGNFDGVHHGHQVILRQLIRDARARHAPAVVLTFDPHPVAVVRPQAAPRLLMTLGDRLATLARHGVDVTVVQRFSRDFAAIEADDFIRRFLVEILDAQKILVGHDLNFGRGRSGNVDTLIAAGARHGFAVEVIGPVEVDGVPVHSSRIRELVAAGDVASAHRLLGRPHRVRGRVRHGAGRGKGLGFATANVRPRTPLPPGDGVYVTVVHLDGQELDSVTSIGSTPTFGGGESVIEAHIFADVGDIYGRPIALDFLARLRDQQRFESPTALVAQIEKDVAEAKAVLAARRG
ncbi:MAG TPA: bifunctional riboflavin kinase/FAD synthetase [Candidatus Limnocylindrales bacterium]|nr:bifunctional riboflavin kinase/FAD synthetase [Candidatus Limnocylindrales bacterium]